MSIGEIVGENGHLRGTIKGMQKCVLLSFFFVSVIKTLGSLGTSLVFSSTNVLVQTHLSSETVVVKKMAKTIICLNRYAYYCIFHMHDVLYLANGIPPNFKIRVRFRPVEISGSRFECNKWKKIDFLVVK